MINQLLLAILLTIAPISELRGGMPVAIDYALKNNIPVLPIIALIILANILVVFALFFFLDKFHETFMKFKLYNKFYSAYLKRIQKKIDKFEAKHETLGMLALTLFVAIPFPTTGVWSGTILAWLLGLERKDSLKAIIVGVIIAGIIVSLASLGVLGIFNP